MKITKCPKRIKLTWEEIILFANSASNQKKNDIKSKYWVAKPERRCNMIINGRTVIKNIKSKEDNPYYGAGGRVLKLGNLSLHNASGLYIDKDPKNYPKAWFMDSNTGRWVTSKSDKPENCLVGCSIDKQLDSPFEALLDYALFLQGYYNSDQFQQMNENISSINNAMQIARYQDERRRRKLIN